MKHDPITYTEPALQDMERIPGQNVQYLCFEGGGGKGVIFLGALQEMERRGILRFSDGRLDPRGQIRGVAGSSAGALTAVLLASGYSTSEIARIILNGPSLNRLLDLPARPARLPTVAGCRPDGHGAWLQTRLPRIIGSSLNRLLGFSIRGGSINDDATAKLRSHVLFYLVNLVHHWGLFSGCAAHDLFNRLIASRAARLTGRRPQDMLNLTFARHRQIFGTDLVLTGSNISTGRTGFFSPDSTPNFPVAAAARISMSLPIVFKPMRINAATARRYAVRSSAENNMSAREMTGVWVDGGYMNNLPRTAFAHRSGALAHTLCFSLNEYGSAPKRITNLVQYLGAYLELGFWGTGESQSSHSTGTLENTVPLVAGDQHYQISMMNFAVPPAERIHLIRLIEAARTKTGDYFDGRAV